MLSIRRAPAHVLRWKGTTSDIVEIVHFARTALGHLERVRQKKLPVEIPVEIVVTSGLDEDRYSSVDEFEQGIESQGIESLELKEVTALKIIIGSKSSTEVIITVTFSK